MIEGENMSEGEGERKQTVGDTGQEQIQEERNGSVVWLAADPV